MIDDAKLEYISKFFGDMARTIFAVGLASFFFVSFPMWIRITLGVSFVALAILGAVLMPDKSDSKRDKGDKK